MTTVILEKHALYDNVVTSLTIQNPDLKQKIKAAYDFRAKFVRKCLAEIGFRGKDLSVRTSMYVTYAANESLVNSKMSMKQRIAHAACDVLSAKE